MTKLNKRNVTVILYHRILPHNSVLGISCDAFEAQLKFLKKKDYCFLDSTSLAEFFAGCLDPVRKYILLTFDDAWADNFFYATPLLEKYSAKALIAVCSSLVNPIKTVRKLSEFDIKDDKTGLEDAVYGESFTQFLSWDELRLMKSSGIWDYASHGGTHLASYSSLNKIRGFHPVESHWTMKFALDGEIFVGAPRAEFRSVLSAPMTRLATDLTNRLREANTDAERLKICSGFKNPIELIETDEEFKIRVSRDLTESKKTLHDKLGVDTKCLVWPWGHYSEISENIALNCGYKMLFTTEKGKLSANSSSVRIPRIVAPKTLSHFKRRIGEGFLGYFGMQ